ncbi:MAG: hypothetical protein HY650_05830 [Acidobacteria bacterium]|nr:hypothetical protein [Acidobacteriota bacterium]
MQGERWHLHHEATRRRCPAAALVLLLLSGWVSVSPAQGTATIVTTVAGGGAGDMLPATAASLSNPNAIAFDAMGNAFIADTDHHRIRKIETDGTMTTIAGTGTLGFGGDGMAAAMALLNGPRGVAVDGMGNIFIADSANHRIRKIDAMSGNISTVGGNGTRGFSGDGAAATAAMLNFPRAVALDAAGVIYVADTNNHRIRKIEASANISTVAGDGTQGSTGDGAAATAAKLNFPTGVAVDAMGNVFIADSNNHRIRQVTPANMNFITTVAGTGSPGFSGDGMAAASARLNVPTGVALGPSNSLLIADMGNSRIRSVDLAGGNISTAAGSGARGFGGDGGSATATAARLDTPFTVTSNGGSLYIADSVNQRIRSVDAAGVLGTFAGGGVGDSGAPEQATLQLPGGIAVDPTGVLYIADTGNHRVRRVETVGRTTTITTIAGTGAPGFSGDGGEAIRAELNQPEAVAVDNAGNIFVADAGNQRIRRIDTAGGISTVAGTGERGTGADSIPAVQSALRFPFGIAVDGAGALYIADTGNNRVRKVDPGGTITTLAGTGVRGYAGDGDMTPATQALLNLPLTVAVTAAGDVLIADAGNHRIRRVNGAGTIATLAGSGTQGFAGDGMAATAAQLNFPWAAGVDGAGNLLIADFNNARVRRVDAASGNISTLIGTGVAAFGGDGGAPAMASVSDPRGVALDAQGNTYISDSGNSRIRKISAAPAM